MESKILNQSGKEVGKITLPESVFGLPWNADLVHQVVTSIEGNMRNAWAHTKNRGDVSGGGKKPWRQKGTGRARHGSTRSPIWVGGGVTHGPRKDKNYKTKINKKMKAKALYTVISKKLKDGEVIFVENLNFTTPKTRDAKGVLSSLKVNRSAYIAIPTKNENVKKSFNNFSNTTVDEVRNLNALDVLNHKFLVISNPAEAVKFIESKMTPRSDSGRGK